MNNDLPTETTKLVDNFTFTHNGQSKKLGDLGPAPLGTIFDEVMESIIRSGWSSGNFQGLSKAVSERLSSLIDEGYELVIKPKVSINGNTPEPDLLFIKKKPNGALDFDDAIYIDNKYVETVNFTPPLQQIVNNVTSGSPAEVVTTRLEATEGTFIDIPTNTLIKIKKVEIFTTSLDDTSMIIVNKKP